MAEDGSSYSGVFFLILMIWLVIELYADFSGYMDIVTGISKMLGIELQQNFKQPIFFFFFEEIWHRWHITLGEWCKEFIFYSVSIYLWFSFGQLPVYGTVWQGNIWHGDGLI